MSDFVTVPDCLYTVPINQTKWIQACIQFCLVSVSILAVCVLVNDRKYRLYIPNSRL